MPDDPEKALQALRQRIISEGLPKLSAEALRSLKREAWQGPKHAQPPGLKPPLSLSPETLRLFREKADPAWLWKRR